MNKQVSSFAWCQQLQCPPSACNDSVKKILQKGLNELLWEEIANVTFPAKQATIIRKNALLHKLRNGAPDKVIQCMKNLSCLKSEQKETNNQISVLEEEYEQQDFLVRQKMHNLKNIRSQMSLARASKDLLEMKYSQTSTQLRDCEDMKLVAQHLMPSTSTDLDSKAVREMLDVVMTLYSGANKRQVWDTVSSTLGMIKTSILWCHLYQTLLEDVDKLIKLEDPNETDLKSSKKFIDINIAKICGHHICIASKCMLHEAKANKHQESVLEFIEQIEAVSANRADIVSEWLAIALEVRKLEVEKATLQEEVDKLLEEVNLNSTLIFDVAQLTSDIQAIDVEMEEYVRDIQQSLIVLKSAPSVISIMKEKLCFESEAIMALRTEEYNSACLQDVLDTEVDLFYETLDLNALRKIMLKGDIGEYRHTKCCFDEASISVTSSQGPHITSYFPMIQIPIYSLIECYKNLSAKFAYKKFNTSLTEETKDSEAMPVLTYETTSYNTVELLNLVNVICDKTTEEIEQFNEILNAWVNQSVQETMKVIEDTVDDVSFPDWSQRYSLLLYMIQNTGHNERI